MHKRIILTILGLCFFAYILFCMSVYFFPELYFYDPSTMESRLEVAHSNSYDAQRVEYSAKDDTPLYAWYTPPQKSKPIIVFMHGNSYNIEKFYHKLIPFAEAGYGTFIPEYRGFGGIKGKITQSGLEQDVISAINWLYNQGFKNRQIILYGMSLGSYTATYAAHTLGRQTSFRALILEVPFDSMYADVKQIVKIPLPLKLIMKDKYDNLSHIKDLSLPILIMGASDDTLVPIERAKNLFKASPDPKKMIIYKGAEHSDLYKYRNYKDIMDWLQANEKVGL
ncbi:MAG: alpha/beta fold hydrolase [Alphaproteobacteria bacterium]|nr:alpha/beta fold hydrolase [Alphaproteobacteria bacterium]